MEYRVIEAFRDRDDAFFHYGVGEKYPRAGHTPSAARIEYLSGDKNRLGRPIIRVVEEKEKKKRKK